MADQRPERKPWLKTRYYPVEIDARRIFDDPKRREADAGLDYRMPGCIGIRGERLNRFPCYQTFQVVEEVPRD
jgi:hypothetical protein